MTYFAVNHYYYYLYVIDPDYLYYYDFKVQNLFIEN